MMGFVPAGMVSFRVALGLIAQTRCATAWSDAKADERAFLAEEASAEGFTLTLWTRDASVAGQAYAKLRPMLADGSLRAMLRGPAGAPVVIEPADWHASGADRLADVLRGTVSFSVHGSALERGEVMIRAADLNAVLKGEPTSPREPELIDTVPRGEKKVGGRPPKAGVDDFWIEACRLIYTGEQGTQVQTQKQFVDAMLEWSVVHQSDPYSADAVEKKIKMLWRRLGLGR